MSKNIRSQYIKNLVADKDALSEQLKANTKDSLRSLLEDTVKDSLRDILNEEDDKEKDDNSFEVEDVDIDTTTDDTTTSDDSTEGAASTEGEMESGDTDDNATDETGDTTNTADEVTDDTESDEMWKGLDDLKGENGEYDLTGMGSEDVIKVLKVMGPEDRVRVVKNDNGSVTLTDDETQKEYIIDIEGTMTGNEAENEPSEDDMVMNEEDLGYTDNYQNKTAMTTPSNNEPGKNVRTWDKGAPQGTEKPWVGNKGDMSPYKQNVNEENDECDECRGKNCMFEIEINEEEPATIDSTSTTEPTMDEATVGDFDQKRTKTHQLPKVKDGHKGGNTTNFDPTGKGEMNESQELANMMRKANSILNENKELKKIANELREKINEAVVINASLAKVINLVTENSTTRNEKIDILTRFNNVKTIEESKNLYETISRELKSAHTVNNGTKLINEQLNETKSKATETQIYKSEDLNETIDFMKRLMKIK